MARDMAAQAQQAAAWAQEGVGGLSFVEDSCFYIDCLNVLIYYILIGTL
jgi:hypothetical protein